jgi:hypothetical protein
MFFLLCQWFSMQYMTWTKVSYNRTTICTRLLFVRWKGSCLFLFSWWRGCNWDDKNMLLITEFCDHFVPTEKATQTKKYVFLCILIFICIYTDIVLIGEQVVSCIYIVIGEWGSLYGGRDTSANFTRAFSICSTTWWVVLTWYPSLFFYSFVYAPWLFFCSFHVGRGFAAALLDVEIVLVWLVQTWSIASFMLQTKLFIKVCKISL